MLYQPSTLEEFLIKSENLAIIHYLMEINLLKRNYQCKTCNVSSKLVKFSKNIDKHAWRCLNPSCRNYKNYFSMRKESFFINFKLSLKDVLKVVIRYACKQQMISIKKSVEFSEKTVQSIINKLVLLMPVTDFSFNKLGGPGLIVQVDETMLNYKVKSHRGRASTNKTDALCIVETKDKITRVFAQVIPDKKTSTILIFNPHKEMQQINVR
ncbi:hypothetical protein H312_02861 [Anncaliia algerae PRA339]|uniref:ISXO2-like transposase domain-containing protein n=1 Tax=Anncaliia algerae PRA339 TaxID=1288291 RepID=A0A059EXH7_9MICR|nr:hypothetical protein H312_02861 [Anncaliia algerae PRA339]